VRYYEESHANWIGRHVCNDCDLGEGIIGYPTQDVLAPTKPPKPPKPAPAAPGRILSVPDEDDE
jgi:hypothetical protein